MNNSVVRKTAYAMAKQYVYDQAMWDDCAQEGIIAYWQADTRIRSGELSPEKPVPYCNAAMRRRIQSISLGRAPFGHAPGRGKRDLYGTDLARADEENEFGYSVLDSVPAPGSDVEEAYIRRETFAAALASLTDRERDVVMTYLRDNRLYDHGTWQSALTKMREVMAS